MRLSNACLRVGIMNSICSSSLPVLVESPVSACERAYDSYKSTGAAGEALFEIAVYAALDVGSCRIRSEGLTDRRFAPRQQRIAASQSRDERL